MKRAAGRVALMLVSVMGSLVLAELGVRALGLAPEIAVLRVDRPQGSFVSSLDPILRYVPMPGGEGINSAGLRDREHEIDPEATTVAVLGDSIAWGFCNWEGALPLEQGFPHILEELLGVDVINLGVSGYDTRQEVRLLEVAGLQYGPDVVLVASTPNDAWPMASNEFELLHKREGWEERRQLALLSEHALYTFHLTRLLLVRFATPAEPEVVHGDDLDDPVEAGYARLKELARAHDFEVRVALFPDPQRDIRHIKEQAEAQGFETMHMGWILKDRKDHYEPCSAMHPNAEGHRIAAEAIAPWIAKALPAE